MQPLILYGVPFSQPERAVAWLLLYKQMPFDMVLISPGSKGETGTRHPTFLAKNPAGTIPTIEEPDTGFTLGEAHAILCYLSNRHGWHDVYPTEPRQRARVDAYLHFHHRNLREASIGLVAPKIRKDLNIPEATQLAARSILGRALKVLESSWLAQSRYLAGPQLTLADFAAYVEIGQLQPCFTNLQDFEPFPNIRRWLDDMKRVDGHETVHAVLAELGAIDREAPSMDKIRSANISALGTLREAIARMDP